MMIFALVSFVVAATLAERALRSGARRGRGGAPARARDWGIGALPRLLLLALLLGAIVAGLRLR